MRFCIPDDNTDGKEVEGGNPIIAHLHICHGTHDIEIDQQEPKDGHLSPKVEKDVTLNSRRLKEYRLPASNLYINSRNNILRQNNAIFCLTWMVTHLVVKQSLLIRPNEIWPLTKWKPFNQLRPTIETEVIVRANCGRHGVPPIHNQRIFIRT
jgi:hypothetical protein